MMTSFYNLLKYAATGIASPDMTYYDKLRASTLMGGATVQTLTGQPPLSFKSDGTPLISWSMKGNGSQTGTPTPDNPVLPEFVGVRTANDMPVSAFTGKSNAVISNFNAATANIAFQPNTQYAIGFDFSSEMQTGIFKVTFEYTDETSSSSIWLYGTSHRTFTSDAGKTVSALKLTDYVQYVDVAMTNIMLNTGNTALPYEPFGYKIPITCAGQTQNIYLSEPLRKALDGSDAVDVLSSTGTITRAVDAEGNALATPTTQIVDVPEIPTTKGQNTLTVETELQPSEMTITFKG